MLNNVAAARGGFRLDIFFLAMVVVDIWAAGAVISRSATSRCLRSSYTVVALVALAATVATTGFLSYFSNPNTHVYGWPIPRVIFQRETATSPWLDYVGPTLVLAYPMNFIIYMFLPSVVFIGIVLLRRRHEKRSDI
jgi:hypothetical protein